MQPVLPSTDINEDEPTYRVSFYPKWTADAVCAGMEEARFFGASNPDTRPQYTLSDIKAAQKICAACPVSRECLIYTLTHRDEYGVFAGSTNTDRRRMLKRLDTGITTMEDEVEAFLHWLKEKTSE